MPTSQARLLTASGSRYLTQLCKHWSHKFAVDHDPDRGIVPFGEGRVCTFAADGAGLTMRLDTPDEAGLARLEGVVVEHLKRFAFREEFGEVVWTRLA